MSLLDLAKSIGRAPDSSQIADDFLRELSEDFQYELRFRLLKEFLALIEVSYRDDDRLLAGVIPWIKSHRPEIWNRITQIEDAIDLSCLSQVISLREYRNLLDDWLSSFRKGFAEFLREASHE